MLTKGMFSSTTDEWETPQDLFDELNKEFGFTLDVCATEQNAKVNKYYTKSTNGLNSAWYNNICWMNPPYGRAIGNWVRKAFLENHINHVLTVCLLPARTDTKWFHDYIYNKAEIRFLKGRLKFGDSKNSAPFPSMIVIFKHTTKQ